MVSLRLYLENVAGDWFGWVEDYPGAFASGPNPQAVLRVAPARFADYLKWLRAHGEPLPDELRDKTSADFSSVAGQTIPTVAGSPCEIRHFMPSDGQTLPPHEFERHLRLAGFARAALLDAARAIPPHEWDSAPLGGQSIRASLQHRAETEISMLGRIGVELRIQSFLDPLATIAGARATFEGALRKIMADGKARAYAHDGAPWTLRKVLRLTVWHERHIAGRIAERANPTAYMKSVERAEAVVWARDVTDRTDNLAVREGDADSAPRHTQASSYYY